MMGLVSRLIPEVNLPSGLKGLEDNATADGFGLTQLFLRIVRQAISHGRVPLVVNIDDAGQPYFATYAVRNAINWDTADQGGRQDLVLSVFREFRRKEQDRYSTNARRSTASSTWTGRSAAPACETRPAS